MIHRSSSLSGSTSPLSPDHKNSVVPDDVIPKEQPIFLPSPPPSFYRRANMMANSNAVFDDLISSPSPLLSSVDTSEQQAQLKGPPPSILESMLFRKPNSRAISRELNISVKNARIDPLLTLERKQKAIQDEIQLFLDAQSDLLNQGNERTTDNISETDSNSSKKKYLRRENCPGILPVRQPRPKPIGLMEARTGIKRCMKELIHVKCEEVSTLEDEILMRQEALNMVSIWKKKISQAKQQINGCYSVDVYNNPKEKSEKENLELVKLKEEKRAAEIEIQKVEEKLAEMKAKHKQLNERINQAINRQEARLSSYRGVLRDTETEVNEFLKNPPISNTTIFDEPSFASLPPSHRTLSMAKEFWNREMAKIQQRKKRAQRENKALKEGIDVWRTCLKYVVKFEGGLRKQIHSGEDQDKDDLNRQITKLIPVIEQLEKSLYIAEKNSWNLLICAIGAELEAFREGEKVLKNALNPSEINSCRILNQSSLSNNLNTEKNHNVDNDETARLTAEDNFSGDEVLKSPSF